MRSGILHWTIGCFAALVVSSICPIQVSAANTGPSSHTVVPMHVPELGALAPANATNVRCHVLPVKRPGRGYGSPGYPDCDRRFGMKVAPELSLTTGCNGGCGVLNYHGGPVITTAESTLMYVNCASSCWGNPFQFLTDFYASAFVHAMADQYMKPNVLTTSGRYTVNPSGIAVTVSSPPHTLFDSQLQTIIVNAIRQQFPSGGGGGYNKMYAIFLPQGQDLCFDGGGAGNCYCPDNDTSCLGGQWKNGGGFCAYHSSFDSTDALGQPIHVIYQAQPYDNVSTADGSCQWPDGPNGALTDSTNSVFSHEISETITDPDLNAWWRTSDGQENGDICAYVSVHNPIYLNTRAYEFQMEYSNAAQQCVGIVPLLPTSHNFNGMRSVGTNLYSGTSYSVNYNSDILWRSTSGSIAMWLMNGAAVSQSAGVGVAGGTWAIVGQRDFDGDGSADILFRDGSGNVAMWLMNGAAIAQSSGVGNAPTVWSVAGTGDFDGNGKADILWRDTSGNVAIWAMNGAAVAQSCGVGNASASVWSIAGVGDFNGDGKSDILWRDSSGNVAIWFMNGCSISQSSGVGNASASVWSIAGTGDFNGDGKSDILWRDTSGNVAMWMMNGAAVSQSSGVGNASASVWSIALTGDFDGNGKSDLLWRDTSGNVAIWFMNGAAVAQSSGVGNASPSVWSIAAMGAD